MKLELDLVQVDCIMELVQVLDPRRVQEDEFM